MYILPIITTSSTIVIDHTLKNDKIVKMYVSQIMKKISWCES